MILSLPRNITFVARELDIRYEECCLISALNKYCLREGKGNNPIDQAADLLGIPYKEMVDLMDRYDGAEDQRKEFFSILREYNVRWEFEPILISKIKPLRCHNRKCFLGQVYFAIYGKPMTLNNLKDEEFQRIIGYDKLLEILREFDNSLDPDGTFDDLCEEFNCLHPEL